MRSSTLPLLLSGESAGLLRRLAGSSGVSLSGRRRIAVIGCGGSGKTHLARRLGALLNVPVIHLDAVYYDTTTARGTRCRRRGSPLSKKSWSPRPHG